MELTISCVVDIMYANLLPICHPQHPRIQLLLFHLAWKTTSSWIIPRIAHVLAHRISEIVKSSCIRSDVDRHCIITAPNKIIRQERKRRNQGDNIIVKSKGLKSWNVEFVAVIVGIGIKPGVSLPGVLYPETREEHFHTILNSS
jgi:hypothetical protein